MNGGAGVREMVGRILWHTNRTPACHLVKIGLIVLNLADKQERQRIARDLAVPSELVAGLEALRRDGYARLGRELDGTLLEELSSQAAERVARADELAKHQLRRNKSFWLRLLDEDIQGGGLDVDSVFVRFALQEPILRLVTGYFGEVPLLSYVLLSLSRHAGEDWKVSQLWHRDYDDTKVLKIFTYLSDVPDESYGPFTFLPRAASRRVRYVGWRSHLRDEVVFRWVDPQEQQQMIGAARSTFIVDTRACYHMGSRVGAGRTRLMYTAAFISAPPIYPAFTNGIAVRRPLGRLERLVLRP